MACQWWILACLVGFLSVRLDARATCIHDALPRAVVGGEQEYGDVHPFARVKSQGRQLSQQGTYATSSQSHERSAEFQIDDSVYKPIRITPYYDAMTLSQLPDDKQGVIHQVIPEAIAHFQQTLRVVPVKGNLTAQHTCNKKWNTVPIVCSTFVEEEKCFEMPIPDEHFGTTRKCSTCPSTGCIHGECSYSSGQGVPASDYLLYVRSVDTSSCAGQVIAYAMACQKDQYDRPTFGMINFCPSRISTAQDDYDGAFTTAVHEITHALGFSSFFIPYMRNPDGTPRTPRDKYGEPPIQTSGTCHNGKPITSPFVKPDTNTVKYYTERDHDVAKLVTPRVAGFVQQHFNCSTLTGAELESNDPGCIGSHWDERLFESEYMSPVLSFRNILSGLTLAFFEDSGWYHTNVSMAQRLVFGKDRGCSFATDKCINPATTKSIAEDHYCTSNAVESCSVDATSRSVCTIQSDLSIPSIYQYFLSTPTVGSSNAYADYCPMNIGYSGGDCTAETNLALAPGTRINILGETYCPACKCTSTTLRSADSANWIVNARRVTGCYAMRCVWKEAQLLSVAVKIQRNQLGDSITVHCTSKGQQLSVEGFTGMLTCPDPFIICGSIPPPLTIGQRTETQENLTAMSAGRFGSSTTSGSIDESGPSGSSSNLTHMEPPSPSPIVDTSSQSTSGVFSSSVSSESSRSSSSRQGASSEDNGVTFAAPTATIPFPGSASESTSESGSGGADDCSRASSSTDTSSASSLSSSSVGSHQIAISSRSTRDETNSSGSIGVSPCPLSTPPPGISDAQDDKGSTAVWMEEGSSSASFSSSNAPDGSIAATYVVAPGTNAAIPTPDPGVVTNLRSTTPSPTVLRAFSAFSSTRAGSAIENTAMRPPMVTAAVAWTCIFTVILA